MIPPKASRRLAASAALISSLLLLWLSQGVGIIGRDGDPSNRMYLGVLALGCAGALVSRFRARGLSLTMHAMALALALILIAALVGELGLPWSGPLELVLLNGFFVAAFGLCGRLFGRAA